MLECVWLCLVGRLTYRPFLGIKTLQEKVVANSCDQTSGKIMPSKRVTRGKKKEPEENHDIDVSDLESESGSDSDSSMDVSEDEANTSDDDSIDVSLNLFVP